MRQLSNVSWKTVAIIIAAVFPCLNLAVSAPPKRDWPADVESVEIASSADDKIQKARLYRPEAEGALPLLVALHSWGGHWDQKGGQPTFADWCIQHQWALIHPDFRGPNRTPEALGSDLMVQDILDAVAWAQNTMEIDPDRIYLMGGSGGAHASMLMAGRHPEIWAGVSAWCGISDLAAWHDHHTQNGEVGKYARDMEAACGGSPDDVPEEYQHRSPLTWLSNARGKVALDLYHGIHDGRTGSVPFAHSLHAFNRVALGEDQIPEALVQQAWQKASFPDSMLTDQTLLDRPIHFQKQSATARVTIFEGGHEILHEAGLNWLNQQRRDKAPVWEVDSEAWLPLQSVEKEIGQ